MRKFAIAFFILSSILLLASCGNDNGQSDESTSHLSSVKSQVSSTTQSTSMTGETQVESTSSSQTNDSNEVDTKNLTTEQIEKWVASIWIKRDNFDLLNDPKYKIVVEKKEDNLIYANVEAAQVQIDTLDVFRINSDGYLEETGYFQSMPDKDWIVVSKKYLDTSMVNENKPKTEVTDGTTASNHERAEMIRTIMKQNQGFNEQVLAAIPDNEILEANAGNATNSQIAQTAENLLQMYPNLKS